MVKHWRLITVLCVLAALDTPARAQQQRRPPIIDMHLHAHSLEEYGGGGEAGVEFEQGGRLLLDFVGLHELGHAYAHGYGLNPSSGFFAEHNTNYLAYAFMRSTKNRLDRKVMAVLAANVEGITPVHASIDRFETFRSREHPPTEAWYNSAFTLKAAEVYEARGLGFLEKVRDAFKGEKYGSVTNEEILNRLEKIQPGHVERAARRLPELAVKKSPQAAK